MPPRPTPPLPTAQHTGPPRITPPLHAAPTGPWDAVRTRMRRDGTAVVYSTRTAWLDGPLADDEGLRRVLGHDWPRYQRTTDPTVRDRFAASRLILKHTAAAALGADARDIDLAYQTGGRPYLRGLDQIQVSLTHTGDLIAVGISRHGRIGVDTEPLTRTMDFDREHPLICTPAEHAQLAALPDDLRNARMLRLWTLKEAYTKALGQGRRLGFTAFGFAADHDTLLTPDGRPAAHGAWAFASHPVLGRYLISVACHDEGLDTSPDTAVRTMLDEGFFRTMNEPPRPA
ncbi:4'-phosphopantetheinyl transferase family protein [Streptomyces sp. NRRL F-5727]|uniref:4'-phosphopantetheinyl transferase family protein n=1 Tax=Streptomyces sp. NRRL F-5727 TaxID=1463871 RepID=UPI000691C74E|nr:4'-phosphopantetheinyl transferase superfamily protein [Streptomyces sp. NRRL F-5727]